jgi:hypothetical protein
MAATLPILPVSGRSRPKGVPGSTDEAGDEPGGQNRRVPEGFGARRALRA